MPLSPEQAASKATVYTPRALRISACAWCRYFSRTWTACAHSVIVDIDGDRRPVDHLAPIPDWCPLPLWEEQSDAPFEDHR